MTFHKGVGIRAISIIIAVGFIIFGPLSVMAAPAFVSGGHESSSRSSSRNTPEDWPMFRYSANRNGVTTGHGPQKDTLLWSNTSSNNVYSSPAVADGRVFFGAADGKVWAFNALTGKLLWTNTTASGGNYGTSSSPAVNNSNVFIYSNDDHSLYSFNASTGKRNWKVALGTGSYGGSSPVVVNGKVYVGSVDDHLYVRNENDGSAAWNYQIGVSSGNGYGVESSPAVVGDRVYFGGGDMVFRVVNITTHALVWSKPLASYGYPSPSVVGNYVYFADGAYASNSCVGCNVYAYKLDGTLSWKRNIDTGIVSSPTYYKGYIFIGSNNNTLYALNATDGTITWSYTTTGNFFGSPSISNDVLYIGSKDHKFYAFDFDGFADGNDGWKGEAKTGAHDGDILWNHTLNSEIWATAAISDGIAYIVDLSNKIWAIGTPYVNVTYPQVLSTNPSDKATNVSLSSTINAHMSQVLDWNTVTGVNFTLKDHLGNPVAGTVSSDFAKLNVSFNPSALLKPHETYSTQIKNLKNSLGNKMPSPYNWTFTTIDGKPVLSLGKVSPTTGNLSKVFQFSVLYADPDNDAPVGGLRLYLDGSATAKTCVVNSTATAAYHDGNYVNGEAYIFNSSFTTAGNHTFQFKVNDGFIENVTQVLKGPVITSLNKPPVFSTVPDQHVTQDIAYKLDMTPFITDPDNTTAQLKLNVTSKYLTSISGLNTNFLFPASAKAQEDIVFKVTDGINWAQTTVKFLVTHIDHPPVVSPLKDISINASVPYTYDLAPYIKDQDTPLSSITISTNSSYITVSGLNLTLNYPKTIIMELVNVTVKDLNNTVYATFWVTVLGPLNKAPTIDALPDATPTEDVNYTYDLAPYVHDDGLPSGTLTIMLVKSSGYVTLQGMKLKMLYPDGVLTDILNITVTDGQFDAKAQLLVKVKPVNDAPVLSNGHYDSIYSENDKKIPTAYEFNVTCGDIDNSDPMVYVLLDNNSNQMTRGGKTVMTIGGRQVTVYYYTFSVPNAQLTKGTHNFQFKADDLSGAANAVVLSPIYTFTVDKAKTEQHNQPGSLLPMLLILTVGIIVVAILVAVMMMRRKKKDQALPPPQPSGYQQADLISAPATPPAQPASPPPPVPPAPPVYPPQQPPVG